jgi:hypothetical protein
MKKFCFIILLFCSQAFALELPIRPDPVMTPGAIDLGATKEKICNPGYTATVRNVPESVKKQVFNQYKIDSKSDKFEIDHLISLELGGTNDINNLWPQSYTTLPWNAHKKDVLENRLHKMICEGSISIQQAQQEISSDWVATYTKYIGEK